MQMLSATKLLEEQLARSMGLDKYATIITTVKETDVAGDPCFQRLFNAFFRVRRNSDWRKKYYSLFERAKKEELGFAEVIACLYKSTGNIEASFASKMVATINPDKPIWDQYVTRNLGIRLSSSQRRDRVELAIQTYNWMEDWYGEYVTTDEARQNIAQFDALLPSYSWLSSVKKIDFLLWCKRSGEPANIDIDTTIRQIMQNYVQESHGYCYLPEENVLAARKAIVSEDENMFAYVEESRTGIKSFHIDRLGPKKFAKLYEVIIR